jgi:hypothetical protein
MKWYLLAKLSDVPVIINTFPGCCSLIILTKDFASGWEIMKQHPRCREKNNKHTNNKEHWACLAGAVVALTSPIISPNIKQALIALCDNKLQYVASVGSFEKNTFVRNSKSQIIEKNAHSTLCQLSLFYQWKVKFKSMSMCRLSACLKNPYWENFEVSQLNLAPIAYQADACIGYLICMLLNFLKISFNICLYRKERREFYLHQVF